MRGGKTESKITGPLFPRLHVNDTEKGGPKPPPRNKMALYEQLSIPSQRFTDAPASNLHLPSIYGGTLTNMDSSNQISGALNHSNGRQGSCSADRILNKTDGNSVKRSMTNTHAGDTNVTEGVFPATMCTFQPRNVSQMKRPSLLRNEAELSARRLMYPAVNLDSINHQPSWNKERYLVSSSFSIEPQTEVAKRLKTFTSVDRDSEGQLKVLSGGDLKMQEAGQGHDKILCNLPRASQEPTENVSSGVQERDTVSFKSLKPLTGEEYSELLNRVPKSSSSQHKGCDLDETSSADAPEQLKFSAINNSHGLRSESFQELPLTFAHSRPLNAVGNNCRNEEEIEPSCLSANVLKRNEDPVLTPVMHTMSCSFISPDDVVDMIGHAQFWKARRAIINQQRVFSMQVFELHRIIKVQKVLAGSKNLWIEESLFLGKAFSKSSSMRDLSHSLVPENSSSLVKSKHDVLQIDVGTEKPIVRQPHIPINNDIKTADKQSGHDSGKAAVASSSLDNKLPMWCLPQLGNQWLVPVMSPSEGLIYKPFTEPPCPPPGAFRANIFGSCWLTSTTRSSVELLNTTGGYSFPVAPPIGPTYFAPYPLSIMSPSVSASNMDQVGATVVDSNEFSALYQNSCIMATERKIGEFLDSKDSEKPECRANIKKRTSDDALPLFPTAPTDSGSAQPVSNRSSEQKTQVIKVIPHNPRLASESAARIIQLIQEERKHSCS